MRIIDQDLTEECGSWVLSVVDDDDRIIFFYPCRNKEERDKAIEKCQEIIEIKVNLL
jgi:hypothetical protein